MRGLPIANVSAVYVQPVVRTRIVIAALVLATAAVCGGDGSASAAHPVGHSLVPSPRGSGASTVFLGGGRVTYGMPILTLNRGATRIKVLGVHLVEAEGMRLIGARVAGPHRPVYQFIAVRGFPGKYNRKSVPALGATIRPPRRGWGMLVGLRVTPGRRQAVMQGVTITYRRVGHRKVAQQTLYGTFIVCTRKSQLGSDGRCDPPTGSQRPIIDRSMPDSGM